MICFERYEHRYNGDGKEIRFESDRQHAVHQSIGEFAETITNGC